MSKYLILIVFGLFALIFSCTKSKIEVPPLAEFDCDTIKSAYSTSIQPLISTNCANDQSCHAAGTQQTFELTTYAQIKDKADQGRIMARAVNPSENTSPMPPSGLLPESERLKLQCWIENGSPLDSEPVDPEFCDTVDTKFATFIKPLVDAHCGYSSACHSSGATGGRPELTSYDQIKAKVDRISARALDTTGSSMPPSGYLPKVDRDKIQCWIDEGALEN